MKNLFAVILTYVQPLDVVDSHRANHMKFLDENYAKGLFIASGRKATQDGGVIIACCDSIQELHNILAGDPFYLERVAEYAIHEFTPTKYIKALEKCLKVTEEE
jgi:uncharacterized protein YciI